MPVFTPVTPPVVTPATLSCLASFRAATTPRSCTVTLYWWQTGGAASAIRASDTSPAITDSTTGWLATGMTVTAPSDAASVSIGVNIAGCGASEVHYVDEVGIFPGVVTQWTAGGFVGNTTASIQYSDDGGVTWLPVRGGQNVTLPSTTQQVTVDDYEAVPGVTREYQATVQTAASPVLGSQPSGIVSATITSSDWWLLDPTNPSSATPAVVTALGIVQFEQSAVHVPIGAGGTGSTPNFVSVVSSGFTGLDGTAVIQAFSAVSYQRLGALATSGKTLFLSSPFSDGLYLRLGPMPGGMSSGTGNKARDAIMQASTAANPKRTLNVSWVAQKRPAV